MDVGHQYHTGFPIIRYIASAVVVSLLLIILGLYGWRRSSAWLRERAAPEQTVQPGLDQGSAAPAEREIYLYLTADGRSLRLQAMRPSLPHGDYAAARYIMRQLIDGPSEGYLLSPWPRGAELNAIFFKDRMIVIDLPAESARRFQGATETQLALFAAVNSLLNNLERYDSVRLLIDGRPAAALGGDIDITQPLRADPALVM
ncbi:GerMN domain-containing protein [Candidatus Sumerlaeota bacterium]|nr:GerMN domain-containing protein [Candidatus Sumerlaeota bacterium]